MTFNILWPAMRWPSDREIEVSSVGEHNAHFFERYDDVPDDQWAGCDAVVSVNDIPEEFQQALDQDAALAEAFERLTPGRRRAYLMHFTQPKQAKTRWNRIEKSRENILNGVGLNDRYQMKRNKK